MTAKPFATGKRDTPASIATRINAQMGHMIIAGLKKRPAGFRTRKKTS
jgi:hypothetical protein